MFRLSFARVSGWASDVGAWSIRLRCHHRSDGVVVLVTLLGAGCELSSELSCCEKEFKFQKKIQKNDHI